MSGVWRIQLLADLCAMSAERTLTHFGFRNANRLLAYLAYYADRAHSRELLLEQLWPEADSGRSRDNFRKTLSVVRQALEPPGIPSGTVLIASRRLVQLNPATVTTDVAEFRQALAAA